MSHPTAPTTPRRSPERPKASLAAWITAIAVTVIALVLLFDHAYLLYLRESFANAMEGSILDPNASTPPVENYGEPAAPPDEVCTPGVSDWC